MLYQLFYWLCDQSPNLKFAVSKSSVTPALPQCRKSKMSWQLLAQPGKVVPGPQGTGIREWTHLIPCHLISLSKLRLLEGTILLRLGILLGAQSQVPWHMEMDAISSDETANTQKEQQHCVWAREQPMSWAWVTSPCLKISKARGDHYMLSWLKPQSVPCLLNRISLFMCNWSIQTLPALNSTYSAYFWRW